MWRHVFAGGDAWLQVDVCVCMGRHEWSFRLLLMPILTKQTPLNNFTEDRVNNEEFKIGRVYEVCTGTAQIAGLLAA